MRRALPFALVLGVAATGCDDSVDVHLIAPPGETTTRVEYDCVSHIEVVAYGDVDVDQATCVPVPPGAIRSLRDHDLSGLLAIDLPAGLYALDVRGVRSDDDDCGGPGTNTVFHGEAFYAGGWDLDVALERALDCADYSAEPTNLQLLALGNLLAAVPATRCTPPAAAAGYSVRLDHQFPYFEAIGFRINRSEPASLEATADASGAAAITGPHFRGAVAVATCLDLDQATLCAPAGTGEVITITPELAAGFAQAKQFQDTAASIGLVWDSATRQPLAGATIERLDGINNLGFRYFDFSAGAVTVRPGAATSPSGLFAIEIVAPTTLLVSAPGFRSRTVVVGAFTADAPGVRSIPLSR
jgi:hypothetical protein